MSFAVIQNKRACKYPFFTVHPSFENNTFETLEEAVAYANEWLGDSGPLPVDYQVGQKFTFTGPQGTNFIEIVEPVLTVLGNPPFGTLASNEQVRQKSVQVSPPHQHPPQ